MNNEEKIDSTPGYNVGEKKSISEYVNMDAEDESLRKYKEALLGKGGDLGDPSDPRLVIITEMKVVIQDHDDIVYNLAQKGSETKMKEKPFTLKQKCNYKIQVSFKCQHEIITGLKLVNFVYKKGIQVHKEEEMLGSFSPSAKEIRTVTIPRHGWEEAPGGMLGRGNYKGKHKFVDDDGKCHLEYEYTFEIRKEW
eukprot:TRINITY_DN479_c0_g1_i1.p1 TRINITY_DN479_c0_g1~~TRINITY_DN479_c0_g1_i1.p1  ORF type:complete len:195 (-),score=59.55 TRINITY_DN479_c0_g1_i1:87-671(-)